MPIAARKIDLRKIKEMCIIISRKWVKLKVRKNTIITDGDIEVEKNIQLDDEEAGGNYYLTVGQVAEECGFPSLSTLRWYTQELREFIDVKRTASNHRRYSVSSLKVLKRIKELCVDQNMTSKEARDVLIAEGYQIFYEEEGKLMTEEDALNAKVIEQMVGLFDRKVADRLKKSEHKTTDEIAKLEEKIQEQAKTLDQLTAILEHNRELMEQQEKQNQKLMDELLEVKEQTKKKKWFERRKK